MATTWSEFLKEKMPENDYDMAVIFNDIWLMIVDLTLFVLE